jgi:hypothetical protein
VTSILRATTLNFSTTSPDTTCETLSPFFENSHPLTDFIVDIASTLWTIIEENVAIICACLPMCRIVLAFLFPQTFGSNIASKGSTGASGALKSGSRNKHGYERSNSPSRHQSWKPYTGPGGDTIISHSAAAHQSDDTSEEFILTTVQRHGSADDQDGAIRKTTKYEISYETQPYQN